MFDSIYTSATDTWTVWNCTDCTTTSTAGYVWRVWSGSQTAVVEQAPAVRTPTPEQLAAIAEREAREKAAREKAARERLEAEKKAERLLVRHLDRTQRRAYRRLKAFHVTAPSGRLYRIKKGWAGNVEEMNLQGRTINRFCIHPTEPCPDQDNMLAQKMLLEANEEHFLKTANRTPIAVN